MNKEVDQIIEIVALFIFIGVMLFPFLVFFVYVFFQNSKRKSIRQRTVKTYSNLIGASNALAVRYCSEPRFRSWIKIFPWDGTGVLVPANGVVTFLGEKLNGTPLHIQFVRGNSTIAWLGKCPWPNGAVSWFVFETQGQKHYFTSETGPFVFGSNSSTRAAFDQSQTIFAHSGGQAG